MTDHEPEHLPLRTTTDVVLLVRELLDQIVDDEHAALRRLAEGAPAAFPSRSSGASPVGGPTNRSHDFGTPDAPEVELVPQHSDPVGETVAWDAGQSVDMPNLRKAFEAALLGMRAFEECRSHLAKTNRREQMKEEDRSICWLCIEAGYKTDLGARGRDSNVNGLAPHKPRCGWHYEFVSTNRRDAPLELTVKHCRGERIYDVDVQRALGTNTARKAKNRKRKRR